MMMMRMRMRMMRCSVWFVVMATCLLLTSYSEAASSGGLRRIDEVRETREPTASPTAREPTAAPVFGGDDATTDAPTAAPFPDDVFPPVPNDENPAAPAAPSEFVPAPGGEDQAGPTLAPSVPDGNGEDGAPTVAPSAKPNEDSTTAAPTQYSPDDETFVPSQVAATETAPTQAPTVEIVVTSEPTIGNNDAPSDYNEGASPVAAPTDTNDEEGGEDEYPYEYERPTEEPAPYVPVDDDPVKNEPGTTTGETWVQPGESPEEMAHDKNVLIAVSVICGVAVLLMIITAQQMMENPDGCCASTCRLAVGCSCCLFRTICFPCRAICGGGNKRGRHQPMMSDNNTFTHDLELS